MPNLILPGHRQKDAIDAIARRMVAQGQAGGDAAPDELPMLKDPWQPRWALDSKWVTFECGCVAERCPRLAIYPKDSDPIIFRNLPEQAVYSQVCHRHNAGMNVYVRFGGYSTFDQWRRDRRHLLFGRTKADA